MLEQGFQSTQYVSNMIFLMRFLGLLVSTISGQYINKSLLITSPLKPISPQQPRTPNQDAPTLFAGSLTNSANVPPMTGLAMKIMPG